MKREYLAKELIDRYIAGACTDEEAALVEAGFNRELKKSKEVFPKEEIEEASLRMQAKITRQVNKELKELYVEKPKMIWKRVVAAACVLFTLSFAFYFYNNQKNRQLENAITQVIEAGGNRASLTLVDGTVINLNEMMDGADIAQAGVTIEKQADGQLIYSVSDESNTLNVGNNTIKTPNGGQYQIQLPDGTKVWLNAGSSLKYPVHFSDAGRWVELSGEAYFEVQNIKKGVRDRDLQDKGQEIDSDVRSRSIIGGSSIPFIVKTASQEIRVLGTQFNVSAYNNDLYVKTTLLEGSVSVEDMESKRSFILKPGQQARTNSSNLTFEIIDVSSIDAVDWKNGEFVFNEEPLESIMNKISRWYDVKVEYQDNKSKYVLYGGSISRFSDLNKVLHMLELTGLAKFKLTDGKVIVLKGN